MRAIDSGSDPPDSDPISDPSSGCQGRQLDLDQAATFLFRGPNQWRGLDRLLHKLVAIWSPTNRSAVQIDRHLHHERLDQIRYRLWRASADHGGEGTQEYADEQRGDSDVQYQYREKLITM